MTDDDILYLGVPPVRIDILRRADGISTEAALGRAQPVKVDGLDVPVLALEDLLANKRAAGRKQDLADVELLERFARAT
jgi:predicted nucleotidyltransferase